MSLDGGGLWRPFIPVCDRSHFLPATRRKRGQGAFRPKPHPVKREKILSISILWASLILACALVNHHTKHFGFTCLLLVISAGASAAILSGPPGQEGCRKGSRFEP